MARVITAVWWLLGTEIFEIKVDILVRINVYLGEDGQVLLFVHLSHYLKTLHALKYDVYLQYKYKLNVSAVSWILIFCGMLNLHVECIKIS